MTTMMITGFDEGTAVKWVEHLHDFQTGVVLARFYDSGEYEVDGQRINITVIGNSPVYAIKPNNPQRDDLIFLDHTRVFRQHMNPHT
jgi:hypothetical protein